MIPLFHEFDGKRVVIVGGGSVALRKARRFAREASVTVIAPEFVEEFEDLDCELVFDRVDPGSVDDVVAGSFLVVAATDDPAVNDAITAAGERAGCLVNRADEVGDVVVPGHVEYPEVSVAISTNGGSPTTTKFLRQELGPLLESADGMVRVQRALRSELKEELDDQRARKRLLRAVVEDEAVWRHLPANHDQALQVARETVEKRR